MEEIRQDGPVKMSMTYNFIGQMLSTIMQILTLAGLLATENIVFFILMLGFLILEDAYWYRICEEL